MKGHKINQNKPMETTTFQYKTFLLNIEGLKAFRPALCKFNCFLSDCFTWNATIAIWNTSVPDQVNFYPNFGGEIDLKSLLTKLGLPKILAPLPNPEQTHSCLKTQPNKKFRRLRSCSKTCGTTPSGFQNRNKTCLQNVSEPLKQVPLFHALNRETVFSKKLNVGAGARLILG